MMVLVMRWKRLYESDWTSRTTMAGRRHCHPTEPSLHLVISSHRIPIPSLYIIVFPSHRVHHIHPQARNIGTVTENANAQTRREADKHHTHTEKKKKKKAGEQRNGKGRGEETYRGIERARHGDARTLTVPGNRNNTGLHDCGGVLPAVPDSAVPLVFATHASATARRPPPPQSPPVHVFVSEQHSQSPWRLRYFHRPVVQLQHLVLLHRHYIFD